MPSLSFSHVMLYPFFFSFTGEMRIMVMVTWLPTCEYHTIWAARWAPNQEFCLVSSAPRPCLEYYARGSSNSRLDEVGIRCGVRDNCRLVEEG